MSAVVDYNQTTEDHCSLLVLVQHTGAELQTQCFNRVFDRISRVKSVHIQGQKRDIRVRYKRTYSKEANAWGDFQSHRKVLGLITIGKCSDRNQLTDVHAGFCHIKEEYSSSVINSSLVVFGLNPDGSPIDKGKDSEKSGGISPASDSAEADSPSDLTSVVEQEGGDGGEGLQGSDSPDGNSISSQSSSTSPTSPTLPHPPDITKSPNHVTSGGASTNSNTNKNNNNNSSKKKGKMASNGVVLTVKPDASSSASPKYLNEGELKTAGPGLQQGKSGPEVVYYPSLDSCPDLEDRVREFVTSLYYVLEGKRLDRSFERNQDKNTPLCAPFEKKDFVGVDTEAKSFKKKCTGRLRKHLGDLCLQASMPGDAVLHYNTALDLLRSVNDFMWMAGCLEGLCCASVILSSPKTPAAGGLKRNLSFQATTKGIPAESRNRAGSNNYANGVDIVSDPVNQQILNVEDVVEKYKEAISLYSKFWSAALIELEACLKASRFLIAYKKYLQVSDFLQNVVYINYSTQDDDKVLRNVTLASLYSQIGFKRKAAFFRRVAGMHCVAPDTQPSWSQCYDLILQCLKGYSLSVDPKEVNKDGPTGWPALQYRVLNELIFSARKMANPQVAVRHMTLLLDLLLPQVSVSDQREMLTGLASLTSKCPGTPQPIALESGLILPPVPLLSLPTVRSFRVLPPSPHLAPIKLPSSVQGSAKSGSSGVFLYTPLSMSSRKTDHAKPDFKWVCGDLCEASLQLLNPLMDELKIYHMGLMTSDGETEILPADPTLPADSGLVTIKLKVKPKATGTLKIQGYTSVVFGVTSNCRLKELPALRPQISSDIDVEVIPSLPIMTLTCSLPKATTFTSTGSGTNNDVVASGAAVLFAGQSTECIVTLKNTSEHPVEMLSIKLNSKGSQDLLSSMLTWSEENIQSQLPLASSAQLCFCLCINGISDFLAQTPASPVDPVAPGRSRADSEDNSRDKTVEAVLSLQYSGGLGLEAGYARQCSLALHIDTLPSVYITKWSLQHTDVASNCRLCLDLVNQSGHQMDICDGKNKPIALAPLHSKRIALEVPRLDPSQVDLTSVEVPSDRVPAQYRNNSRRAANPYSQALAKLVDIQWFIPSAKAQGKVVIDYLTWTAQQLKILMATKVHWEVCLNRKCFLPSSRFSFMVGQLVEVTVLLENNTDESHPECDLCLQPLQNAINGDLVLAPESFSVIGSPVHHLEQISQGASLKHSCSFIFFTPGIYHLSIACKITELQQQDQASSSKPQAGQVHNKNLDWTCGLPVRFEVY